jgi:D-arabinose 1-dehydrogenase-like Zn-dependent alcohol dehydrogenase
MTRTMRVMATEHPGDYDVMRLQDWPIPALGPREVLVRNHASGVCYHDHLIRVGIMKRGIRFPLILGHEGAGVVAAVGSHVTLHKPGDRVACMQWTGNCGHCRFCRTNREPLCAQRQLYGHDHHGTYADHFIIQEDSLQPLPAEIGFEEGAILSCAIGTILAAIRDVGRTQAGERILVTGAGGGLGIHAVQMARTCGAQVIAQTSSPEKVALIRSMGADEVVISKEGRFAEDVKRVAGGEGVDVVCDNVGAPVFQEALRACARGARYVLVGELTGDQVTFSTARLFLKGVSLLSVMSTSRTQLGDVIELVRRGRIKPIVTERFPLAEASRVHRLMVDKKLSGRVLLMP